MTEQLNKISQVEIQPPLFYPDGTPNPEIIEAYKQLEEEEKQEFLKKLAEEMTNKIENNTKVDL